jgi:thymidylate kinase
MTHLVLINGASGVGKTTTVQLLKEKISSWGLVHPDGLWDTPNMRPEEILDMAVDVAMMQPQDTILIDCQIRPSNIQEIIGRRPVSWSHFLIVCTDSIREQRLISRGSTEKDFPTIATWQRILKEETKSMGYMVIDSTNNSIEAVCSTIFNYVDGRPDT